MAKDWAKPFYNSKAWELVRDCFVEERRSIDGGMCQRCGREPGLIVHHKIHLTPNNVNDSEISLNQTNFEYICQDCHNREHHASNEFEKIYFDKDGNVRERPTPPPVENFPTTEDRREANHRPRTRRA
jgi:5-methylcytosine-specific restriction protein A